MSENKIPTELMAALDGPKGSLSAYLEVRDDAEIAADIRALAAYNHTALRDEFAGKAMQGMLANSFDNGHDRPLSTASKEEIAEMAYGQADAMLEARKK